MASHDSLVRIQVRRGTRSHPISNELQDLVMVFDHSLAAWQRIHDRMDAVVEEPRDPLRIHLGTADQAELLEERVGDELGGAVEVALFPRRLDLSSIGRSVGIRE